MFPISHSLSEKLLYICKHSSSSIHLLYHPRSSALHVPGIGNKGEDPPLHNSLVSKASCFTLCFNKPCRRFWCSLSCGKLWILRKGRTCVASHFGREHSGGCMKSGEAGSSLTGEEPPESRWEMLRAGAQVEAAGMCTKGKMGSMRRGETEW